MAKKRTVLNKEELPKGKVKKFDPRGSGYDQKNAPPRKPANLPLEYSGDTFPVKLNPKIDSKIKSIVTIINIKLHNLIIYFIN